MTESRKGGLPAEKMSSTIKQIWLLVYSSYYSFGGSNYISVVGQNYIIKDPSKYKVESIIKSSTAPMRLIKYNYVKVKGRINNQDKYGDNVYNH